MARRVGGHAVRGPRRGPRVRTAAATRDDPLQSLSGQEDAANHHTLTWTLEGDGPTFTLSQDNNPTPEAAAHSEEMWGSLVASVKAIAERE